MIWVNFDELKDLFTETAKALKGYAKRNFMAGVVEEYGRGGQRWAEQELGWYVPRFVKEPRNEMEASVILTISIVEAVYQ